MLADVVYAVSVVFLASVGVTSGLTQKMRSSDLTFFIFLFRMKEGLKASPPPPGAGGLRGLFHAVLGVVSRSIIRESRSNRGMPKYFIFLKRRGFGSGILFVSGTQM